MKKTKKPAAKAPKKTDAIQVFPVEHSPETVEQQPASQLPVVANTPDVLMAMAIKQGVSIDVLERLSALQKDWLDRQAKSAFLQAKSDFLAELPTLRKSKNVRYPTKQGEGEAVDYYYAPLGVIAHAINPLMKKFGLSYDWDINDLYDEKGIPQIEVVCILSHVAGFQKQTKMKAYLDTSGKKSNIQQRASTVTYLQRYTLIGAAGLTTDDADNDGRKGQGPEDFVQHDAPEEQPTGTASRPLIGTNQMNRVIKRIREGEDIAQLTKDQFTLSKAQIEALNSADEIRLAKQGAKTVQESIDKTNF